MEENKKTLTDIFGHLTKGQIEIIECGFPFLVNRIELFEAYPAFKDFIKELLTDYSCFTNDEKAIAMADAFHQAKSIVDKYELKKARSADDN